MQTRSNARWQNELDSFDPLHTADILVTDDMSRFAITPDQMARMWSITLTFSNLTHVDDAFPDQPDEGANGRKRLEDI